MNCKATRFLDLDPIKRSPRPIGLVAALGQMASSPEAHAYREMIACFEVILDGIDPGDVFGCHANGAVPLVE
jgi:hypothetical protein